MEFIPGWLGVAMAWLLFAGSHGLLSSRRLRPRLVSALGAKGFQGIYSLVALASFSLLISTYWENRHAGPLLWDLAGRAGVRELSVGLSFAALALALGSLFQPPPTSMLPTASRRARGLARITRHPLFVFLGVFGLSHMLVNGYASDVAFFAGFPVWAGVGGAHLDARKRRSEPEALGEFFAETSILPFGAILAGRGRGRPILGELPWLGIVIGSAAAALLFHFHERLFG